MADAAVQPADISQETSGSVAARHEGVMRVVFGPGALFVFAACALGLAYSGGLPFTIIAAAWPGANLAGVLIIALIISLNHAYTFAAIGAIKAGAVVNVLKTPLSFASSWALAIFLSISGGAVVGYVLSEVIPLFGRGLGLLFGDQTISHSVAALTTSQGMVLYGTFGVLAIFLLLFIPPKLTMRIMLGGLVVTVAAWIMVSVQLAAGTPQSFHTAWDAVMGSGSFMNLLSEGDKAGIQLDGSLQSMLLAGVAMGLVLFSGYFFPAYFSQEARAAHKSLRRASMGALLACGGLMLAGGFFAQRVIPLEWLSAQAVLSQQPQFQNSTLPWLPFYAAILRPNIVLYWAAGIGWVTGALVLATAMTYTASRIVQRWAGGGYLPEGAQFFHPELRSPLIAVLLVSMAAELGLVIASFGVDMHLWLPLAVAFSQIVPVITLLRLSPRQKGLDAQSAALLTRKVGPIPLVKTAGLISLVFLFVSAALLLTTPALSGTSGGLVYGMVFMFGIIWYYGSRTAQSPQDTSPK